MVIGQPLWNELLRMLIYMLRSVHDWDIIILEDKILNNRDLTNYYSLDFVNWRIVIPSYGEGHYLNRFSTITPMWAWYHGISIDIWHYEHRTFIRSKIEL